MKKIYLFLLILVSFTVKAQTPIITMIADGDESGGTPKVVEIYANGAVDFSQYSLENQNNASTSWSNTFSLAPLGTITDDFVYIFYEGSHTGMFNQNFPNVAAANKLNVGSSSVLGINGNDRVRVVDGSGNVVDIYGVDGQNGTGTNWEYKDGYAKRNNGTGPDPAFDETNWSFFKGDLNTHGAVQDGNTYESIIGIGTYVPQSSSSGPYFTEDFENGGAFPSGWTLTNGTDDWQIDDGTTHGPGSPQEGDYCAYFDDYNFSSGTTADMVTPNIDLSGAIAPELTFWYWDSGGSDTVEVLVSTDGTTYNNVFTTPAQVSSWTKYTVDLSAYTGQTTVTIAFRGTSVYGFSNPHVDNIKVAEPPSCLDPTNLAFANVTTDTVDLSWDDAGGNAGNYKLEYQADGASTWIVASTSASSPYTLTGLTPNTLYHWQLTKDCGASGTSLTVGGPDFQTDCPAITSLPVLMDFESATPPALPDCFFNETLTSTAAWVTTSSTGTHPSSASPHSGNVMLKFNSYSVSSGSARFISPAFDLPNNSGSSLIVSYYMYHDSGYSSSNDRVQFQVFDGANWIDIGNEVSRNDGTSGWKKEEVDVSAYAGQTVKFALKGISGYGNDIYIDDLMVEEVSCSAPSVSLSNITDTTVDLIFTGGSSGADFELVWGPAGFTPDFSTATVLPAGTTSYQITGLSEATDYEIYVRSDCGSGLYSDTSAAIPFYTTYPNNDCSGAIPLMIYGPNASAGHEISGDTTYAYDTGVHSNCDTSGTNLDLWYTFLLPQGETGVKILTAGDKGSNIEVALYDACGGNLIECQGRDSEHNIQGLTPGTQYFLQVWHDDFSSIKGSFTLAIEKLPHLANDDCAGALNLPVFPAGGSTGNETHTTTDIANNGTIIPSCESGVVKDIFFKFTVPNNASDVVLITKDATAQQLNVALYDACGGNEITCESGYYFHPFTGLNPGQTYYVQLWHNPGDEGNFDISMEVYEPVINDDCANAIEVASLPYIIYQDASFASGGVLAGGCSNGTNDGVWYKFTGDGSDITITADPDGWDNEISVYDGGCSVLNCVARTDIYGTGGEESLTFTSVAGTEYLVNIAHYTKWSDQMEGPFTLTIESNQTSSIDGAKIDGLTYYPNPVQNTLNIQTSASIDEISLMDLTGKIIQHFIPEQTNAQIDMKSLRSGLYFVQVRVNDQTEIFKVIKQ